MASSLLGTVTTSDTAAARKQARESRHAPVILVVEDDAAVRQLLEMAVRSFNFTVRSAATGKEALEIYRHEKIDMVLIDVQMPATDGPETLARLKEIDLGVVCCFMSGYTGKYTPAELASLGAVGFLQKPFHLEDLRALILESLAKGSHV